MATLTSKLTFPSVTEAPPASRATPFLKWAGGKTQLLGQFERLFPPANSYRKYLEPFVGSGAVFFRLLPTRAYLADNNEELINCYKQIQENVETVIQELAEHKAKHGERHYYLVRAQRSEKLSPSERAARLIYLNKTCFNGLYRVNGGGRFNVPMGRYSNPPILDEDNLRRVGRALKNVHLSCMRFDEFCLKYAKPGDFVYFDPPYAPVSKTSNFTSYTKDAFGPKEQERLRDVFVELDSRNCLLMLSNSNAPIVRKLYKKYKKWTYQVSARRTINSVAAKRHAIKELVVLNRPRP